MVEDLDIDVEMDLPGVGKNLRDKLEVTLNFKMAQVWQIFQTLAVNSCPLDPTDPVATFTSVCFQQYLRTLEVSSPRLEFSLAF